MHRLASQSASRSSHGCLRWQQNLWTPCCPPAVNQVQEQKPIQRNPCDSKDLQGFNTHTHTVTLNDLPHNLQSFSSHGWHRHDNGCSNCAANTFIYCFHWGLWTNVLVLVDDFCHFPVFSCQIRNQSFPSSCWVILQHRFLVVNFTVS